VAEVLIVRYEHVVMTRGSSGNRTTYKTPTGCTPFRLVYGKACHLPVKIEHRAYWALKQCNMDLTAVAKNHFMELNELIELRDGAYENTHIYKERIRNGMILGSKGIKTLRWETRCCYLTLDSRHIRVSQYDVFQFMDTAYSFACNTPLGTLCDEFNRLSRIDDDLFTYKVLIPELASIPCDPKEEDDSNNGD
nr:reverse transcriptase domain-containing protein [Tanacetum cinerariifolium]